MSFLKFLNRAILNAKKAWNGLLDRAYVPIQFYPIDQKVEQEEHQEEEEIIIPKDIIQMSYTETFRQTPNVSNNRKITPTGIVLHHTAGAFTGSVTWCLNPQSQVSYHCIVDTTGERIVLAKDYQRTWHAGQSTFNGKPDCNSFMLGIAVSGDTTKRTLTKEEIDSVAQWCVSKMKEHKFGIESVTTHRAISPGRKNDVDTKAEKAILKRITELL